MRNINSFPIIKRTAIILAIICGVVVMLLVLLPSSIRFFYSNPPKPKHQYGEFPFSITYEINGVQRKINDTLIIEYEGIGWNEALGKYNLWNTYYKSLQITDENLVLFNEYVEGVGSVKISYVLGSCEYYMGLPETEHLYESGIINPGDIMITSREETKAITTEELYDNYKIRIIEKTVSKPLS